jgi:hypothetical protein
MTLKLKLKIDIFFAKSAKICPLKISKKLRYFIMCFSDHFHKFYKYNCRKKNIYWENLSSQYVL